MSGLSSRDSEDDDPNVEYVRLKMRITDLTGSRRQKRETAEDLFLRTLKARLEEVKQHYFFREREAEVEFQKRRKDADNAALMARLRGESEAPLRSKQSKEPKEKETPPLSGPSSASHNLLDNEEDGDSLQGGMLELLEEMPTTEPTETGATIKVVDMSLPKGWSGKTPKSLLSDLVSKTDKYAAVVYNNMSGLSRSKRASVRVRWAGGRDDLWQMEDVACHASSQAEQYIATVALHGLTYPIDEGFRSSVGNPKGAQTSFRHLPPNFRDLWNELEVKRKEDEDKENREVWGVLSSVIDEKLAVADKVRFYPLFLRLLKLNSRLRLTKRLQRSRQAPVEALLR